MTRPTPLLRAVWCVAWPLVGGCHAPVPQAATTPRRDSIVVIYSSQDPAVVRTFECPADRCERVDLSDLRCTGDEAPAPVVVVTGHSGPPDAYLHATPETLASAIACYRPELVVLDTCYGVSSPLLVALAARGMAPFVVGPTYRLPAAGLLYEAPFFTDLPASARARFVRSRSGEPLSRFRLDAGRLRAALDDVAGWSVARLTAHLQCVLPNLVKVPIPGTGHILLVPIEPERFRPRRVQ